MTFRIIPATEAHAEAIAPRMRVADAEEVFAATGRGRLSALRFSLARSDFAYTIEFDGQPETMFGCGTSNIAANIGAPWLLGSDALEKHYRHFLRGSRFWIEQMTSQYSVLRNIVDDRNEVSKRWLEWLGFTLSEPVPIGYEQRPFRVFEMRANNV